MSEDTEILCAGCEERPVSATWDSDIYCDECLKLEGFDLDDDQDEDEEDE